MSRAKSILAALALLYLASQARAETRVMLVEVKLADGKPVVTIHSDEKKDRRKAASPGEAAKALADAKGWGSVVIVYVTTGEGVRGKDLKEVMAAIKGNLWMQTGKPVGVVPDHIRDHFHKKQGK